MWTTWGLLLLVGIAGVASANTRCPGAPDKNHAPGKMNCKAPTCTAAIAKEGLLWPSNDPTAFYQCAVGHTVFTMHCAPGTCFSFKYQLCINAREWINTCKIA